MEEYSRRAILENLDVYDVLAAEHDSIEITEWNNGEGYDIEISSNGQIKSLQLAHGEIKAIKKLIKKF